MVSIQREHPTARVHLLNRASGEGRLEFGPLNLRCAVGRGGVQAIKREGDGASPMGIWRIRLLFYRPDRMMRPRTHLPVAPLRPDLAWCDLSGDRNYNRLVRLPYPTIDERLWREDGLYDLCAVLSYNERPRVQGRGSAIFMHVARPGYLPTAGCVALAKDDLLKLLEFRRPPQAIAFMP